MLTSSYRTRAIFNLRQWLWKPVILIYTLELITNLNSPSSNQKNNADQHFYSAPIFKTQRWKPVNPITLTQELSQAPHLVITKIYWPIWVSNLHGILRRAARSDFHPTVLVLVKGCSTLSSRDWVFTWFSAKLNLRRISRLGAQTRCSLIHHFMHLLWTTSHRQT